ncbi:hypothetical protein JCM11641_003175 [Rhodosporidiobolus odoratus]
MDAATLGTLDAPTASYKRWSAGDLLTSAPPLSSQPLARSTSATRIRISPASSTTTSRAPSPTPPFETPPQPVLARRITSPFPVPQPVQPTVARRLSKPLIQVAALATSPAFYITLVRSTHPSLLAFFLVSVSAVISNKALLRGFFHGLTYALTAWQMLCATLGTILGERIGAYRRTRVPKRHDRVLLLCSLVFSLEILASNLALRLVPVPFHVSLRACSPILTLLLSVTFFKTQSTLQTSATLLLILLGASFTSHRESFTSTGSLLLLLSAVLLSAKSLIIINFLTSRLNLSPIDILARLSPLSMAHCALFAIANGEVARFYRFVKSGDCTKGHLVEIALNGVLSFALVPLGLLAEKKTRPPALAVTTHAAQAITILTSLVAFGLRLSPLNFIGVALTLAGGILYAIWDARDTEARDGLGELPQVRGEKGKRAPD